MATTPEYGEELLIEQRESEEAEESARHSLPRWEDVGEAEVAELREADEETRHPAIEDHEAHRAGAVCGRCGGLIGEDDDLRLTVGGEWVHEVCP